MAGAGSSLSHAHGATTPTTASAATAGTDHEQLVVMSKKLEVLKRAYKELRDEKALLERQLAELRGSA
jgi:hypothetical protein